MPDDLPADAFERLSWRQGSEGTMASRFVARAVRPANRILPRHPDGSLLECWLLVEWPEDAAEPTDYWLSTLPPDTPIGELVRLGKIRWRIADPKAHRTACASTASSAPDQPNQVLLGAQKPPTNVSWSWLIAVDIWPRVRGTSLASD